jgi:hypothetical protein
MRACPFAKTQKFSSRIATLFLSMLQQVSRVLLTVSHDPDECDGGKTAQAFDSMVQVLHDLPMVAAMENFQNKEQRIKIGISDAF